jgi:hypothetical protein
MNRRTMLKSVAAAGAATLGRQAIVFGQSTNANAIDSALKQSVLNYLSTLRRADGGFAWEDQQESHLTPTFAAIGCYRALGAAPPNTQELAQFIRAHHPARLKKLEQEHRVFDFQQIQSLVWLGEDVADFRPTVEAWRRPVEYLKQYERHGYPVFQSEAAAIVCRELVDMPVESVPPRLVQYLESRRRPNGSFNNTPAADGGDGHVMNTWWGLRALGRVGTAHQSAQQTLVGNAHPTVAWLRACQLLSGGFTFAPSPEFGGVDDACYTWSAVRALELLKAGPERRDDCIRFLHSLANADGGFADRPGWLSNPLATYYVLDALASLGSLGQIVSRPKQLKVQTLPRDLKVFTIQLEAPGQGSPSDAVDLALALKIHLWGAKNAKPDWIAQAQSVAKRRNVPVTFFAANEEYGTWINVPGQGTYSHMSDVIAPAGKDSVVRGSSDPAPVRQSSDSTLSWSEFRKRRLAPLEQANGRLIWQFGENEELVRMLLDDSLTRGGFAAISTFHFGNPDFTNSEPFLHRWRGQIPFVALQDAHASEAWWASDMLAGFRTLFLATEPTWEAWLAALQRGHVAAVRHDAASGYRTWMHTGSREVHEFLREREAEWRWWPNEGDAIKRGSDADTRAQSASAPKIIRPWATATLLQGESPFEVGTPDAAGKQPMVRIRCWWDCTNHGRLKQQVVELVSLTLNGKRLDAQPTESKSARGERTDHYYLCPLPESVREPITLEATLRHIATGQQSVREFRLTP